MQVVRVVSLSEALDLIDFSHGLITFDLVIITYGLPETDSPY